MTSPPLANFLYFLLATWPATPTAHIPSPPAAETITVVLVLVLVLVVPRRERRWHPVLPQATTS